MQTCLLAYLLTYLITVDVHTNNKVNLVHLMNGDADPFLLEF